MSQHGNYPLTDAYKRQVMKRKRLAELNKDSDIRFAGVPINELSDEEKEEMRAYFTNINNLRLI